MLVTGRLSLGPFCVPKKELAKPGPGLDGIHEEPPPGALVTVYSVWESTSILRGIIHDLSRFTYIFRARLEGSLGEAEKQKGKGKCGDLDWRPALGCSSPLGYLERQAFSFEVRTQSCQNLKLKPGLWG